MTVRCGFVRDPEHDELPVGTFVIYRDESYVVVGDTGTGMLLVRRPNGSVSPMRPRTILGFAEHVIRPAGRRAYVVVTDAATGEAWAWQVPADAIGELPRVDDERYGVENQGTGADELGDSARDALWCVMPGADDPAEYPDDDDEAAGS